ncbi:hypothetical protein F5I97DRAFT_188542 [Phlebopus sp. FC_14]|nr:hypothetical protein F5I97DRAFT_188542 [Phlebopus sp. FC_14]
MSPHVPKLLDGSRDFSLYVLDPLEALSVPSQAPHAPDFASAPRGVAVALGLMSWALESDDSESRHVAGTIINNSMPGMTALEVIFALRETKRVQKAVLNNALNSWGRASDHESSQDPISHLPDSSSHLISTAPYSPANQMQPQTLTRASDFPELYVGPPRRARGRPEGSTSKSKQNNAPSLSSAGTSQGPLSQGRPRWF